MKEQKTTEEYLYEFSIELSSINWTDKSQYWALRTIKEQCEKYATLIDLAQLIRKDK